MIAINIWIIGIFAALFGFCAVWNFKLGVRKGIIATLTTLQNDKIIVIHEDKITPYRGTQ